MTTEILEETVVKLKPQEIEIQSIDHLGIVAGIIDSIGLPIFLHIFGNLKLVDIKY